MGFEREATELDPSALPGKQVALIRGPPERLREGEEALMRKIREVESQKLAPITMVPGQALGKGLGHAIRRAQWVSRLSASCAGFVGQ